MPTLTSPRNPLLKEVRKAVQHATLTDSGLAIAESFHLLEEALRSGCEIGAIIASESVHSAVESHVRGLRNLRVTVLPDGLFESIASTEASQGVMALVRPPRWNIEHVFRGECLAVILDGLQDPGNAGAVLRAAEAFGATGVAFLKGTVSPYNPKCLRASAGSVFRIPIAMALDPEVMLAAAEHRKVGLFALMPRAERTLSQTDFSRRCALIAGSEGRGVSERLGAKAAGVRIATAGVESLNAALAVGIALYHARSQRLAAALDPPM